MTGMYGTWSSTLVAAIVMVAIVVRMGLITPRGQRSRCGACGRFLVRRGSACPCTRPGD